MHMLVPYCARGLHGQDDADNVILCIRPCCNHKIDWSTRFYRYQWCCLVLAQVFMYAFPPIPRALLTQHRDVGGVIGCI